MTTASTTIRPGLLVSLKSSVVGGVTYQRVNLDADVPCDDCESYRKSSGAADPACATCRGSGVAVAAAADADSEVKRWETRRIIDDKAEHERAVKCRSAALARIRKVCSTTSFGLLCPAEQEAALDIAIADARALVDAHNAVAKSTRVSVYALKGRVASDDAEAARAITSEIGALVTRMTDGINAFDPNAIREAATRARELSAMLSDDKAAKIDAAIEQARKAARTIVRRIEVEGEARETVLLDIQRGQIESARIAFLDLSGADDATTAPASPEIDARRFAALDVGTEAAL